MRRERRIVVIAYFIMDESETDNQARGRRAGGSLRGCPVQACSRIKQVSSPRCQLVNTKSNDNSQQPMCIVRSRVSYVSYVTCERFNYLRNEDVGPYATNVNARETYAYLGVCPMYDVRVWNYLSRLSSCTNIFWYETYIHNAPASVSFLICMSPLPPTHPPLSSHISPVLLSNLIPYDVLKPFTHKAAFSRLITFSRYNPGI